MASLSVACVAALPTASALEPSEQKTVVRKTQHVAPLSPASAVKSTADSETAPQAKPVAKSNPAAEKPPAGSNGKVSAAAEKPKAGGDGKAAAEKPKAGGDGKAAAEKPPAGSNGKVSAAAEKPPAGSNGKVAAAAEKPRVGGAGKAAAGPEKSKTAEARVQPKESNNPDKARHHLKPPAQALVPPPPPDTPTLLEIPEDGSLLSLESFQLMSIADMKEKQKELTSQLAEAQQELKERQDDTEQVKAKAKQFADLFQEGVISKRELESAEKDAQETDSKIKRAKMRVTALQSSLDGLNSRLQSQLKRSGPQKKISAKVNKTR